MKKIISLTAVIIIIILLCSACYTTPKYKPNYNTESSRSVWVCEKPFTYFYLKPVYFCGYPYIYPTGICTNKNKSIYFCLSEQMYNANNVTLFEADSIFNAEVANDAEELIYGNMEYYDGYMEYLIEYDYTNFFDGELPTLRFDKTTKYDFLKQYGNFKWYNKYPYLKAKSFTK